MNENENNSATREPSVIRTKLSHLLPEQAPRTAVIQSAVDKTWSGSIRQIVSDTGNGSYHCGNGWDSNSDTLQDILGSGYAVTNVNGYVNVIRERQSQ